MERRRGKKGIFEEINIFESQYVLICIYDLIRFIDWLIIYDTLSKINRSGWREEGKESSNMKENWIIRNRETMIS